MGQLIINDAVYGFINIDEDILQRLINHPYFQRLGRINQLGMGAFVYPGARHTRFQHSLGALHLMRKALGVLTSKGYFIFDSEAEAALIAILLHDIGHGPYSHVLEKFFVNGITHEEITAVAMDRLNKETHGELSLAISIFKDSHPKHFLHELICSQLDADRLDYLCRDSFYTGVREGNVGALRLIEMLEIHPETERLAVNIKGIYTLENYLMSRRLMYWQVYLHKTVLAAEEVLRSALRRARQLAHSGIELFCSEPLHFFLYNNFDKEAFYSTPAIFNNYMLMDDSDIICALKAWKNSNDKILATLATDFIDRRLFKVEECRPEDREECLQKAKAEISRNMAISMKEADYFVTSASVANEIYSATSEGIELINRDGSICELSEISHIVRNDSSSEKDTKCYIFKQRTN